MTRPLSVAVFGAGRMGRHHARIYSQTEGCRLVAVVDKDLDRATKIAAEFGGKPVRSFHDLDESIDAASIAVPTVYHAEVAIPLLTRGVACLVEKPLAPDTTSAAQLLDATGKSGVLLQVGHSERFNPVVRAMLKLAVTPRFIETQRISPFTFRSADIGVVFDMMIHDIDIVLHLVRRAETEPQGQARGLPQTADQGMEARRHEGTKGERGGGRRIASSEPQAPARGLPENGCSVDAVGVNVLGPHEDVANARLRFADQTVVNLTASRLALKTERKIRVFCPSAYLSMDYQAKSGIAIKLKDNVDLIRLARERDFEDLSQMQHFDFGSMVKIESLQVTDTEPLRAEIDSFLDAVRARTTASAHAKAGHRGVEASPLEKGEESGGQASPLAKEGLRGVESDLAAASAEEGYAAVELAERITRAISSQGWSPELASAATR